MSKYGHKAKAELRTMLIVFFAKMRYLPRDEKDAKRTAIEWLSQSAQTFWNRFDVDPETVRISYDLDRAWREYISELTARAKAIRQGYADSLWTLDPYPNANNKESDLFG